MANGAFKFKDNSGNVVSFISGSGPNISFSGGTLDLSGMTGLTLGNLTMSGTTQNAVSTSHAASYLLTSSFNSYTGTTNTIIGSLQTSTGSLNTFTSSASSRLSSIETSTGSLNSYTSSTDTRLGVIESTTGSLNTYTSSTNTRLGVIEGTTSSLNTFTSSANGRLNSIEGKTGSYATTGSNTFNGNLTVTGYIDTLELRTTYISSSILYRSGSTKFGDELTDTHAFTGSMLLSGSLTTTNRIEISNDGLGEGGQIILRGATNRYNIDNWSGNAIRLFREDDSTGANGNVIIFGSGSGQVGINKNGTNATLDVNGSALISGSIHSVTSGTDGGQIRVSNSGGGSTWYWAARTTGLNLGELSSADGRIFVANGGNVGINTVQPGEKLEVDGNISAGYANSIYLDYFSSRGDYKKGFSGINQSTGVARGLHIFNYDNDSNQGINFWVGTNASKVFAGRISPGGAFGINTSSPYSKLTVVGGSSTYVSTDPVDYGVTINDPTTMAANVGGSLLFQGYKTSNTAIGNFAFITGRKENSTAGNEAGYLALGTFNSGGVGYEYFRIKSNGDVGVGTQTPETKFVTYVGSTSNTMGIYLDTDGAGGAAGIGVGSTVGPYIVGNTKPDGTARGAYGGSRMFFNASGFQFDYSNTGSGARVWNTYMTIGTTGNMNVGSATAATYGYLGSSNLSTNMGITFHNGSSYSKVGGVISVQESGGSHALELWTRSGGNEGYAVRVTSGAFMGIGTQTPDVRLHVNGNIKNTGRVFSGNAVTGNIATNLDPSFTRNYILVCDLNDIAGFSLNGFMNAASYTCWNMSSFYIMKNYSSTSANAGITGMYKAGGCDMNIVDLSYGGGRYIAIGYTSNPEIDVIWTGYRLTHMLNADGSAQVIRQAYVTVNSTLASY